jgi:ubiquinone/menaquinone biosynthesis C-methylase UbiE
MPAAVAPGSRLSGAGDGPAGNTFDKYHTKNPVYRYLVRSFLGTVRALTRGLGRPSVLEVGCGEGHLARFLGDGWEVPPIVAFDISPTVVREAVRLDGGPRFFVGSSYALPFPDKSFDLVIMCEVLEHLAQPELALAEISRVARRACLVSVPREPLWRALNLLRGAYWRDLGNTPGHVQWWSRRTFVTAVGRFGTLIAGAAPIPWTVALFAPYPSRNP